MYTFNLIVRQHHVYWTAGGQSSIRFIIGAARSQALDANCQHSAYHRMADVVSVRQQADNFRSVRLARAGRWSHGGTDHHLLGRDNVSQPPSVHYFIWNLFFYFFIFRRSEPSVRGILTACAGISATTGIFLVFLLGSLLAWRDVALICAFVPAVTMIAVCFVSICHPNSSSKAAVK